MGPNGPICNQINECDIECTATGRSFLTEGCNGCRDTVCVNLNTDNNYADTFNDEKTSDYQCACASGAKFKSIIPTSLLVLSALILMNANVTPTTVASIVFATIL